MQDDVFDTKVFGHRLREARKKAGLSQADLATQIGVYQPWISEMEHGGQGPITATTMIHLARALSVSADYLLGLTDHHGPPGGPLHDYAPAPAPAARHARPR